jgi:nucleoside-diphosphate-sugar epimerase
LKLPATILQSWTQGQVIAEDKQLFYPLSNINKEICQDLAASQSAQEPLKVLVTGASGFIGQHVCRALCQHHATVKAISRHDKLGLAGYEDTQVITVTADFEKPASLKGCCDGIDTVIHLAGRAHEEDRSTDDKHHGITVEGTRALLQEAVNAGVKMVIFVSTVKVYGETGTYPVDENRKCKPDSFYGRAKYEAEKLVLESCAEHGIKPVILRLAMVYGPGNRGNLPRMVRAVDKGWFPPLPLIHNIRSMVHVDDVVKSIFLALTAEHLPSSVYNVTDGNAYSINHIYTIIRSALGMKAQRMSVPIPVFQFFARIGDVISRATGRPFIINSESLDKLVGTEWYDSRRINHELGFCPDHSLSESIDQIVTEYRADIS